MAAEWVNQVRQATIRKQEVAMNRNFRRFAKNWLLMADRSPFLFLDVELALSGLEADVAVRTHEPFDRTFILSKISTRSRLTDILISQSKEGFAVIAEAVVTEKGR